MKDGYLTLFNKFMLCLILIMFAGEMLLDAATHSGWRQVLYALSTLGMLSFAYDVFRLTTYEQHKEQL